MRHLQNILIRAMASQNKPSLSNKLAKQNKVIKPKVVIVKQEPQLWVNKTHMHTSIHLININDFLSRILRIYREVHLFHAIFHRYKLASSAN